MTDQFTMPTQTPLLLSSAGHKGGVWADWQAHVDDGFYLIHVDWLRPAERRLTLEASPFHILPENTDPLPMRGVLLVPGNDVQRRILLSWGGSWETGYGKVTVRKQVE